MNTQKERIQQLQSLLQKAKASYATALRNLEKISESIHKMRGELGVREPGVGAEASEIPPESENNNLEFNLDDVTYETRSGSRSTSRSRSEVGTEHDFEDEEVVELEEVKIKEDDVESLRMKIRSLAVRPIEGCADGQQDEKTHEIWESELNATVDKLDHLMLLREKTQGSIKSEPQSPLHGFEQKPLKQLQKQNPLPLSIVSLQSLPTSQNALPFSSRFLNESTTVNCDNLINKKRKLSLG